MRASVEDVNRIIGKYAETAPIAAIRSRITDWIAVPGYAEPGYGPADVVVLGTFNLPDKIRLPDDLNPIKKLTGKLEKIKGVSLEWSDEWTTCYKCLRAVRTCPDGYGWVANFAVLEDDYSYCADCLRENESLVDDLIQEIKNKPRRAVAKDWKLDLEKHGFIQIPGDFLETGFHEHQNDDPEVVVKFLNGKGYDVLFSVEGTGQFDVTWSAWITKKDGSGISGEDLEEMKAGLANRKNCAGFSPAEELKKTLQSGKITSISPEEFVSGSWCKPKKGEDSDGETGGGRGGSRLIRVNVKASQDQDGQGHHKPDQG